MLSISIFWLHKITHNNDNAVNPPNSNVWHYRPTLPLSGYTVWWLSVWKRQGDELCQRTTVPVYRHPMGSADSVTVHEEGRYCPSTYSPVFLSRDRGRPNPPMADTHQSRSRLSWRYYRCDVSRFTHLLPPHTREYLQTLTMVDV